MAQLFVAHRVGGWLPQDHSVLRAWLADKIKALETFDGVFDPVITEFQELIENNPEIYQGFHRMFDEVPAKPPYNNDPTGLQPQVRDYMTMLRLFNDVIKKAPEYYVNPDLTKSNGLIGFPINAILDWPMGTTSGFTTFINPKVNAMFAKMFRVWTKFLQSPASCNVLVTTEPYGWFSQAAVTQMELGKPFDQVFVTKSPNPDEHYGYESWDDFFTRQFLPGERPLPPQVLRSSQSDALITSACESGVLRIRHDVNARDQFWLKGQPYSLYHMLNDDPFAEQFVGGTVYQAFLSAMNYHRWHSPVNGQIEKIVLVPGTYYAEAPFEGFENPDGGPDPAAPDLSQAFITAVAARALVFIRANDPKIGLMCFIAVGMSEVSSCDVTVREGNVVKQGDQLGMFHFGGSTHCLVFRKDTNVIFEDFVKMKDAKVKLNELIAHVE
ncbi:uncharacterized protein FIBRA_01567 [Fibroporia radiculosa]|uniref:L-tryptophan decarboxylase PsiD-like domain-containing protein n=1 Tax=Fibroporia radiculosa TaxID=599839 RepID=J4H1A0_9APHY|nr:uncharacterized protein FIBRA_01567 [Fibroporia radiculosa]CCL99549.1 predicted protein [Fibroporia radiculosa]